MNNQQTALIDIDAFISELCLDTPNGLRELADGIEAKRLTCRYKYHVVHGFGVGDTFGLHIGLDLHGKLLNIEHASAMLESDQ